MIPFITYREPNESGILCYYILQKAFPHYIGIVSLGPLVDSLVKAPIPGYNLYVNFVGVLQGPLIPSHKGVIAELEGVIAHMANWYESNRIVNEPKKYLKFKINAPISTK